MSAKVRFLTGFVEAGAHGMKRPPYANRIKST